MDGHYILPGELAAFAAALLVPPLIVAVIALEIARRRAEPGGSWFVLSASFVAIVGTALTIGLVLWEPSGLSFLRVRQLPASSFPVLPAAFVAFALATAPPLYWLKRRAASV